MGSRLLRSRARLALALGVLLGIVAARCKGGSVAATTTPTEPTGDMTVSPGFGDVARSGEAGGPVSDGRCPGHFPEVAQHRLTLEGNQLALAVEVIPAGTALWIRSGSNHYCNRPDEAPTRVGRGAWSAGTYELLVGTTEPGATTSYTLRVIEER
jgi:hypothetical protein